MLVAAWISRWVERRLKKLSNLAPSTRIGIAKFANAFLIGLSILMGLNAAGVDLTALTVLTGAIGSGWASACNRSPPISSAASCC